MQKNVKIFVLKTAAIALIFALACGLAATPLIAYAFGRESRRVVVVDPGHGGADGGVSGVRTGAKESDLNLSVALLLGEYLEAGGFKVVFTRRSDVMLRHPSVTDNRKRSDMFKRGEIINAAKPRAVVSVHMNFYSSPSRRGAQVFFDKSSDRGEEFAEIVQEKLNRDVNSVAGGREYSALAAEKYILSCSPYPTVIAECGFLSNPLDEANLTSPDFQATLAYALFEAIAIFLSD